MDEISLLDYLKARLSPRRLLRGSGSKADKPEKLLQEPPDEPRSPLSQPWNLPWRSLLALLLALVGQRFFEPGAEMPRLGIAFYLIAACLLVLALLRREWVIPARPVDNDQSLFRTYRLTPLLIFLPLLVLSFVAFRGNQFTGLNLVLWVSAFLTALYAFWQPDPNVNAWDAIKTRLYAFGRSGGFRLNLTWWNLLVILVIAVSAWFHIAQLGSVPLEMTSDHTEKLLDVNDVLNGNHSIFFPRNSGREPIQFYLTAGLINLFGLEMGFTTLKLGMALAFLISLVYVYKLGCEVGSKWTGLLLLAMVGIASWTNILARSGMRLVLAPVFVAPVLFYLLRGLRLARRNDLVLTGIFLGTGLLGYSAFRIMPLVVVLVFLIHAARKPAPKRWLETAGGLGLVALFALIAALPLLSFAFQYPELIAMRTITRMTSAEQAINGPVWLIFLQNLGKALIMPVWRDGNTWITSVVNRPALDVVSAAFYVLGVVLAIFTLLRQRRWQYLALLVSIPVLMLPSILALAFPVENPSLSRAGGAVIPILLLSAIAFESLLTSLWAGARRTGTKILVIAMACGLLLVSARQNYDLVLKQYNQQYQNASWNTSQMGAIARDYIKTIGSPDSVWVVAVAHWVDTRLVAANAGYLGRDYAVWAQDLESTAQINGPKLFFVKADDREGMKSLTQLYPDGFSTYHTNPVPGRDFFTFLVPPENHEPFIQ